MRVFIETGVIVITHLHNLMVLFETIFLEKNAWFDSVKHQISPHFEARNAEDQVMRANSFSNLYSISVLSGVVFVILVGLGTIHAWKKRHAPRPLILTLCYYAAIPCGFVAIASSSVTAVWVWDWYAYFAERGSKKAGLYMRVCYVLATMIAMRLSLVAMVFLHCLASISGIYGLLGITSRGGLFGRRCRRHRSE